MVATSDKMYHDLALIRINFRRINRQSYFQALSMKEYAIARQTSTRSTNGEGEFPALGYAYYPMRLDPQ